MVDTVVEAPPQSSAAPSVSSDTETFSLPPQFEQNSPPDIPETFPGTDSRSYDVPDQTSAPEDQRAMQEAMRVLEEAKASSQVAPEPVAGPGDEATGYDTPVVKQGKQISFTHITQIVKQTWSSLTSPFRFIWNIIKNIGGWITK